MPDYVVRYAKSATLTPGTVDRVTFTEARGPLGVATSAWVFSPRTICIANRHPTGLLWFDYTYPDGSAPSGTITPAADDVFVVLPGDVKHWQPTHVVTEMTLVSADAVPYTAMVMD